MGFVDEIPKQGMGWQPHSNPSFPQIAKRFKKGKNQGAKRNLIQTKPL